MPARFKVREGTITWRVPDSIGLTVKLDVTDPGEFRTFLRDFVANNPDLAKRRDEFAQENPDAFNPHDAEFGRRLLEMYLADGKRPAKDEQDSKVVVNLLKTAYELEKATFEPGVCFTDAKNLRAAAELARDVAAGLHVRGAYDR